MKTKTRKKNHKHFIEFIPQLMSLKTPFFKYLGATRNVTTVPY